MFGSNVLFFGKLHVRYMFIMRQQSKHKPQKYIHFYSD